MKKVLVTGGAGYIGSVTVRALVQAGFKTGVLDNLSTGSRAAVHPKAAFHRVDLLDLPGLGRVFAKERYEAVIHFAGLIQVAESVNDPQKYYLQNVIGSLNLLRAMTANGCRKIVFSSSAAVYGNPRRIPIKEADALEPINPYGETKLAVEKILEAYARGGMIGAVALRYFNAAGAVPGLGENHPVESHLIPLLLQTALARRKCFCLFGQSYPTRDRTAVRDFIHVEDLARAHVAALRSLKKAGFDAFNVGTGKGFSVKDVCLKARRITGRDIPVKILPRRQGDPAVLVADIRKIRRELGWKPRHGLDKILESAWNWEQKKTFLS